APAVDEVLDDIAAERDEDVAHAALTRREQAGREREEQEDTRSAAAADRSLFEEDALDELAFEPEQVRETERFADEFVAVSDASARDENDGLSPIPPPAVVGAAGWDEDAAAVAPAAVAYTGRTPSIHREPDEPVRYD